METSRTLKLLKDVEENLSKYKTETVLYGCYRSEEHLRWILKNGLYNVRYTENREGTVFGHSQQIFTASYLVLYNYQDKTAPAKMFVLSTRHYLLNHDGLANMDYPFGQHAQETDWYFLYKLEGQVEGEMPVNDTLALHPECANGSPLYLHFAETQSVPNNWTPINNTV